MLENIEIVTLATLIALPTLMIIASIILLAATDTPEANELEGFPDERE